MQVEKYPFGSVRELLETDWVTEPTRKVLLERFDAGENYEPRFFDARDYAALKAVCVALSPSEIVPPNFVSSEIDKRLDKNTGNGWRYAKMPPDGEAFRRWLRGLNDIAEQKFDCDFQSLTIEKRNEILQFIRRGEINSEVWRDFNSVLFLEELLAEFAEIFYAHPLAQEEIGYIGFADAHGWDLGVQSPKSKAQSQSEVQSSRFKVQSRGSELRMTNDELRESKIQNPKSKIQNEVDAVVIGTGAGGAPILARLAQAGLKVVALEAGMDFDYREFATDEREQSKLFWLDERLSAGKNALAFGANNSGCGVGGSTLHFTAYTPRPQADDFRLFSEFGVGALMI